MTTKRQQVNHLTEMVYVGCEVEDTEITSWPSEAFSKLIQAFFGQ